MKRYSYFSSFIIVTVAGYCLSSCSSSKEEDPLVVSPASISMHYEDTKQLKADGATSWYSNDEFVAKVNSSGLVTGNHVGETEIVVSDGSRSAICKVTITPEYYLYDDPILQWGTSMSSIKSLETHKRANSTSDNVLVYDYSFGSKSCLMGYTFKNGALQGVMAMLNVSMYADVAYYLLERFQPVAAGDNYDYVLIDAMEKDKCKTIVYLSTQKIDNSIVLTVLYADPSIVSSTRTIKEYGPEIEVMQKEMIRFFERNSQ